MAALAVLRKKAKEMGIAAAVIRSASTAEELEAIMDDHNDDGGSTKPRKKSAVKKSAAKKKSGTKKAISKSRGVKSKPAASRKSSGKAKRSTTGTNGYVAKGGRNLLDGVDFSVTDGWNAREGSPPDRIVRSLRKHRGNREKTFEALKSDVWDFVGKKMRNGTKRSKSDAEAMLRYRISRTAWDFAMRTGQHDKAENRVQYGTGGTGTGTWKPKKAAGRKTKATAKKATSKKTAAKKTTARKSGSKKRSTARR